MAPENGWRHREFTVTWENLRRLLDAGVPFTIDSVNATAAHARAVVGYDERRSTMFLRDPFLPRRVEALAADYLNVFRAHGPRGLALFPENAEVRIEPGGATLHVASKEFPSSLSQLLGTLVSEPGVPPRVGELWARASQIVAVTNSQTAGWFVVRGRSGATSTPRLKASRTRSRSAREMSHVMGMIRRSRAMAYAASLSAVKMRMREPR